MNPAPNHQMSERLRSYLARLRYFSQGHASAAEVARTLVDRLAFTDDVDLFPVLKDSLPEPIKAEVLTFLSELAAQGFARYIGGVGSGPTSEEALVRDQERVRTNYARLGDLAGLTGPKS